jgi:hypothetical protein
MADIFVSYAKADRSLALKLAAMLEAEGWKVWWDTSLIPGDDFRNEIMTQLGRARAVIVIWTDASIKSDWVRSEAGRAQADRKLIPIKLEHLTYKDLPPPFDVLHTENVGEEDKIKAAVVAQLAKPAVEPTAWALLGKGFKWELLSWWGIIGGAITLFTALSATLKLADWARLLVQHWKEWTHAFWAWAFGWLGIHLAPGLTPVLSFLLFGSVFAIGQAVKFKSTIKNQPTKDKYQGKSFRLISWRTLLSVISMFFIMVLSAFLSALYFPVQFGLELTVELIAFIISPIVLFARHRLHAAISTGLILAFFIIIAVSPIRDIGQAQIPDFNVLYPITIVLICILPLILLSVAPAKAVSRRLIFLALGLLLLIALNELSKFGFDVTAPKQG